MMKFFVPILLTWPIILFAQIPQSPCAATVSITDTSKADPAVILVIANAPQASYTITGPATYTGSGWTFIHQNILPGTYTITWNSVAGCQTPPPETKTTDVRGSIGFAGNYKDTSAPKGYGWIDVNTNLNQPTTITVSGPATKTVQGTSFSWGSAPAGIYTVTYGAVAPFTTPPSETQTLEPGGRINFYGNYIVNISETFTLTVNSIPAGAFVYLDGVSLGKAPVKMTVSKGEKHKIKCTLTGYNDYRYDYTAGRPPDLIRGDFVTCDMVFKDYIPSGSWGLKILSEPTGADVFINEEFVGVAPIQKSVPLAPATYKIRCVLPRYPDYTLNYVIPKYSIDAGVTGGGETCWMGLVKKNYTPREIQNIQPRTEPQKQYQEISPSPSESKKLDEPIKIPSSMPPAKKSFFGRVRSTISSFFSNMFSSSRRKSSPPVITLAPVVEDTLQGMWKIKKLYTAESGKEFKEAELPPSQRSKYTDFKKDSVCLEGNLNTDGAPIPCSTYAPYTLSGNTISISPPNGGTVNGSWAVINGKLELTLTITEGSQSGRIKAVFTTFDRPFSTTSTPQVVPLRQVQPVPAQQPVR